MQKSLSDEVISFSCAICSPAEQQIPPRVEEEERRKRRAGGHAFL